jgi:hypothetical protein
LLAGVLAAAVIVSTVAVVVVSRKSADDDNGATGPDAPARSQVAQNAPQSVPTERDVVPDACTVVSAQLTRALVPDADKTNMRSPDTTDRHTECAWSAYGVSRSRQLTVELRAVQAASGLSAIAAAQQALETEQRADSAGKGLLPTQRVVSHRPVTGFGDEGYRVYNASKSQVLGEAIVNVRIGNVLVTVRYAGGDRQRNGDGTPLSDKSATAGATATAQQAVRTLTA